MEKNIKIGKKTVSLSNNVAWALEYRDQFGRDVLQEHLPVLASAIEGIAAVISDAGVSGKITLADVFSSMEGKAMDIVIPLMQTEFMTLLVNVTWAMAKAADETIEPPKQWVRQFDDFPIDTVAPAVYELALKGFVSSKNLKRLASLKDAVKTSQPSISIPSSSPDSSEA